MKRELNPSRVHLDRYVQQVARSVGDGAMVLDAGAGDCPYRQHFSHVRYESADFGKVDKPYGDLTYRCDLGAIPVEGGRYDLVMLTQVLEHLAEPGRVLAELHRVLRPGGKLWLSAPLYYEEHEQPYDFYRYTQFGLRHLLEGAGFEVESVEWVEGYYGTLSYQLGRAAENLPVRPRNYGGGPRGVLVSAVVIGCRPALTLLSRLLASADLRTKWTSSGHCKNYCVVARRPS